MAVVVGTVCLSPGEVAAIEGACSNNRDNEFWSSEFEYMIVKKLKERARDDAIRRVVLVAVNKQADGSFEGVYGLRDQL